MPFSFQDIQSLLQEPAQEGSHLELKRGAVLLRNGFDRCEFIKDVTGLANADGGQLIYGISEGKANDVVVATGLSPVGGESHSRESLIQMIRHNTSPSLAQFNVEDVQIPVEHGGGRVVVIDIEAAATAHQNLIDKRYYLRVASVTEAMEDFQIRDVMNRRTRPVIQVNFEINLSTGDASARHWVLRPSLHNDGVITLERWMLEIDLPWPAIDWSIFQSEFAGFGMPTAKTVDAKKRDVLRVQFSESQVAKKNLILHPGLGLLITPESGFPQIKIRVTQDSWQLARRTNAPIAWRLFMQDARYQSGEILFSDWCDF